MKIFDSRNQVVKIETQISELLKRNSQYNKSILAMVMVGNDKPSEKFVKIKSNLCEKLGIAYRAYFLSEGLSDEKIIDKVQGIFNSREVGGGIVQLPLPRESLYQVLDYIPVEKDIDVISTQGKERFYSGDFTYTSPVIKALESFINVNKFNLTGLKAIVIGDGELVGRPVAYYLSKKGTEVEVLTDYDGIEKLDCKLLVLASGVAKLVKGESLSLGCNVVDFGSTVIEGRCVGDLDMGSELDHLGCISKSPGGMGPLVVRHLLQNFLLNQSK